MIIHSSVIVCQSKVCSILLIPVFSIWTLSIRWSWESQSSHVNIEHSSLSIILVWPLFFVESGYSHHNFYINVVPAFDFDFSLVVLDSSTFGMPPLSWRVRSYRVRLFLLGSLLPVVEMIVIGDLVDLYPKMSAWSAETTAWVSLEIYTYVPHYPVEKSLLEVILNLSYRKFYIWPHVSTWYTKFCTLILFVSNVLVFQ